MFTAMWPDQQPEKGAVVMAPKNAAAMVAEAHLRTGRLLAASGRHDESIAHFRTAAMYGPLKMASIPKIGNARGDTNYSGLAGAPAAEAQFYLAKELVAKGDLQGAQKVLYETGQNLPEHSKGSWANSTWRWPACSLASLGIPLSPRARKTDRTSRCNGGRNRNGLGWRCDRWRRARV